ncbi:hypothetical protein ACFE04_029784 [Oxalis oulophora]
MNRLIRIRSSTARVTHSQHYSLLRSDTRKVPAGHFPVIVVGYDHQIEERFVVNAKMLRHPIFVQLLNISAQEYGFHQRGVLRIPIDVAVFERLVESLRLGRDLSDFTLANERLYTHLT